MPVGQSTGVPRVTVPRGRRLVPRKRRTRAHVIADLAVNHVERQVLLAGHTLERVWHDYGTDLVMFTYDESGEVESGLVFMQVKATDHMRVLGDGESIAVRVKRSDMRRWLAEDVPFILVAYNAAAEVAHWTHIQEYAASQYVDTSGTAPVTMTVRMSIERTLDIRAVRTIRQLKNELPQRSSQSSRRQAQGHSHETQ
jgi:hypothetical protein